MNIGEIVVGLILVILGGFMLVCTNAMVRFQVWSQRAIMGAQYIPSQRTYTVMRIVGAFIIILGIVVGSGVLK